MSAPAKVAHALAAELDEFKAVCRQLWPYVRFFGLCGADPVAVQAVMRMGHLIGEGPVTAAQAEMDSVYELGRTAGLAQAAELVRTQHYGKGMLKKTTETILHEIDQLKQPGQPAEQG